MKTVRFGTRSLLLVVAVAALIAGWYGCRRESVGISFDRVLVEYEKRVIDDASDARVVWVLFPPRDCEDCSYTGEGRDVTVHYGSTRISGTVGSDHVIWYVESGEFKHIEGAGAMRVSDLRQYFSATPRDERTAQGLAEFVAHKRR